MTVVALVLVSLIVVTGAAVRLTGSGLGCSDWPNCSQGHLTPPLQFHALVEFGNRLVTVVLTIVVAATFLAALVRRPFRRDLVWLSAGLVGGVVAQAVLGGIVVYTKLNPYLVMVHFLASMAVVADGVVLVHRAGRSGARGTAVRLVPRPVTLLARFQLVLLAAVLAAGTATTGAGPHAGSAQGQIAAKRIPVALRSVAELHSTLAVLLIGVSLGLAVAVHALAVPERVGRAGRILVLVLVAQGAIGYTQYFTHLPPGLVEVHVLGATALVIGSLQFFLSLSSRPAEPLPPTPGAEFGPPRRAGETMEELPAETGALTPSG